MRIDPTLQGIEAPLEEHRIHEVTTACVLLHLALATGSCLALLVGLRVSDQQHLVPHHLAPVLVLSVLNMMLRTPLRDLTTDLSFRERGIMAVMQFSAFVAPMLMSYHWNPLTSFSWLLISLHLMVVERQQVVRVVCGQCLLMVAALAATPHDDLMELGAVAGLLVCLATAAHALRAVLSLEQYDRTWPMGLRWLSRALMPTMLLVLLLAGGMATLVKPGDGRLREVAWRTGLRPPPSAPAQPRPLDQVLSEAAMLAVLIVALIAIARKLREHFGRRRGMAGDLALGVDVEIQELLPEAPAMRRPPPRDARQAVIEAYDDLTRRLGTLITPRHPAQSAREYQMTLDEMGLSEAEGQRLGHLTEGFERARYTTAEVTADDAREFRELARRLLADREEAHAASPALTPRARRRQPPPPPPVN